MTKQILMIAGPNGAGKTTMVKKLIPNCDLPLVDSAHIMDNSSEESTGRIIARKNIDNSMDILDKERWKELEEVLCES
jgi:adenylate kinase family enzyme